jgi:hypothetical protein
VDLARILAILSERAPAAPVNLEIITGVPSHPRLVPYLVPDSNFWKMYPDMLARDLARFIRLAAHGKPEPLAQITLPPDARIPPAGELGERLRTQQRRHLEESVAYAKTNLGIGEAGYEHDNRRHDA